jgi:hypothetical protein
MCTANYRAPHSLSRQYKGYSSVGHLLIARLSRIHPSHAGSVCGSWSCPTLKVLSQRIRPAHPPSSYLMRLALRGNPKTMEFQVSWAILKAYFNSLQFCIASLNVHNWVFKDLQNLSTLKYQFLNEILRRYTSMRILFQVQQNIPNIHQDSIKIKILT